MASRLNPYISFDGNAREAIETYKDVFGGELTVSTFGDMARRRRRPRGQGDAQPARDPGGLHADGLRHAARHARTQPGNNIAVSLSGDDDAELRGYWDKLAGGGQVALALEKQMWGDVFGMVVDRFGVSWMVNIAQPQS